jgi:uncharacterized protein
VPRINQFIFSKIITMKKLKHVFYLLMFCFVINAQTNTPLPFIEVTGTSEMEITPDEIYVSITLRERNDREKKTITQLEGDLKQILKDLSIPLDNLTLNEANADYNRYKKAKKEVISSKNYTLKIKDVNTLTGVYERLDKMGVDDAYISKLNHSKLLEFTKENRIKAVKAAKEKAEYLAQAVGQTTVKAIEISERENYVNTSPYQNYNYRYNRMSNVAQSYANNTANSFSDSVTEEDESIGMTKIKIRSAYYVKYEIK